VKLHFTLQGFNTFLAASSLAAFSAASFAARRCAAMA